MKVSVRAFFALLSVPALLACSEQTVEVELHSLQASGEVAFVCRTSEGLGVDRSLCPDFDARGYKIFGLVTQTSTEEVAVIDTAEARVVDLDKSVPGYSFLRVPSRPGAIVSSPGGAATFVALMGQGKTGITGIPTTCIGPPKADETARDVTSFPSCHLPTAPGDIAVLIAPPDADGRIQDSCDGSASFEDEAEARRCERPPLDEECSADLTLEHCDEDGNAVGPVGRRKIAVALPDFGEIAIIDGQWLLDQTPGSFPECRVETTLALDVNLGSGGIDQEVPPELVPPAGCEIERPVTPPTEPFAARPAGFAPADGLLYVADSDAPVVHVLDVSNPCAPNELPPLLPKSFEWPARVVTTTRVAASPLTPDGKRYVYAIDRFDNPPSLMAFDVSPGSTDRTPLIRPGSLRVPEPPDRLRLSTPITDVAFALRDLEATDPETGVAESGVRCDPHPDHDPNSAGAQHRPTSDRSRGAQPRLLRGLFGLAMLTSGHVAIVDVDDFDAPCRRPSKTNQENAEDFRGCLGDVGLPPYLTHDKTETGGPTVTNEVSCNVVAQHRFRSALYNRSNDTDGIGAPSLAAFPEFSQGEGSVDVPPENQPKLLAVPFERTVPGEVPPDPQVYIGTTLHTKTSATAELPTDPNVAVLHSLTLPFAEPRAFPANEVVNLVYEGPVTTEFPAGNVVFDPADPDPRMRIEDPAAQYCRGGIYDLAMMGEHGVEELGVDPASRDAFARAHADVLEVSSELFSAVDQYWISPRFLDPEGECALTYSACVDEFGYYDPPEISASRELVILEAYQDQLVVEPLNAEDDEEKLDLRKKFECCFPQGLEYRIRAQKQWVLVGTGGLRSDVTARPETLPDGSVHFRCARDCDPTKKYANPRVFEVASSLPCAGEVCGVGLGEPGVDPCIYDPVRAGGGLRLPGTPDAPDGDAGAISCIYSGLTARFAIYRGVQPSIRGMSFTWQTNGGFRPLTTSLEAVSVAVLPEFVDYVPELQRIAIVDGAQLGLSLVSLDSLRVEDPWPVY